ncbi:MAG: NADH:ubiquinone reductase (Na(+)-transporting) subunit F [Gammaproteobacteria bacterium]|nr:NADH:ubiquinone reductase (Na(+)-transporting) subunit F [Gammaproteobacteria bacterium]
MIFVRKLHKWLTLVIGAQLIVWLVTGTIISLLNQEDVGGATTRRSDTGESLLVSSDELFPSNRLPISDGSFNSIKLLRLLHRHVYRVEQGGRVTLFDATSGTQLDVDKRLAEEIASSSYVGEGEIIDSELLASGSNEVRDFSGPIWRINIDDDLATRIYVSPADGQVLAHRNSRWKAVDFLLMLHFMDYVRADSFNNPQIIIVGFGTLWIAVSGLLLIFFSFSRSDFIWLPGLRSGGKRVSSRVGSENNEQQSYELDSSLSYYSSLSQRGIRLSSNCDGSGSCGLCKVRYEEDAPADTAVDREWINASELAAGFRLGCQHKPRANDAIVVPDMAFQQSLQSAQVVSSRWLTPLLKEIRIRPDTAIRFRPGDHLEFQIPAYDIDRDCFAVPESLTEIWNGLTIPQNLTHNGSDCCARTYSIATAPGTEEPQELTFTVRFAPPPPDLDVAPGIGSSYMCSLQPGDQLMFRGPAGEFLLQDGDREKILIGGGAGMAPLKSMATHLLENLQWDGKLRFWYGARNRQEILYRETFEKLAMENPNFEWEVALSGADDDEEWLGKRGLIHELIFDHLLQHHAALGNCEFYLCGPPLMLAATRQMLRELGVSDASVRFDDFGN